MEIFTIKNKKEEKFLRQKTTTFDFKTHKKSEIRELIKKMRRIMRAANGIGLSANQIGLPYRLFIAQAPDSQGRLKFYAIFNPEIVKMSKEMTSFEEGCLSIPNQYSLVPRPSQLILKGFNMNGKKIKIKAWGLLARVFQHEIDHLNGVLFIDKTNKTYKIPND